MSGKLFIEQREKEGDYVIRRPGADRASGREDTQADAIERAREIDPTQPFSSSEFATRTEVDRISGVSRKAANERISIWFGEKIIGNAVRERRSSR